MFNIIETLQNHFTHELLQVIQVFIDTLAARRPNNLIKQERVEKHVNDTINLRNEEKGQAH